MSVLNRAKNTLIQGDLYAIAGDQHIHYGYSSQTAREMDMPQGFDTLYQYYSTDALFDAIAHSDQPKCLEGTRVAIIKDILHRVESKERYGSICWLKGPAGVGKSALEYTIASICRKDGFLIGGFAFSRDAANQGDGDTLIPTLAVQLSRTIPEAKVLIDSVLKDNQDIFQRSREAQLRLLIIDPLRYLWAKTRLQDSFRHKLQYPTVIAIDGLDECSDCDVQRDIIMSIGAVVRDLDFPLRFLIASRPEAHISQTFDKLQSDKQTHLSSVYLGEDATATRDIQTYLETRFQEIRKLHPHLPETWPSSYIISWLVQKASGQFIYASTVMAYLTSVDPDACLQVILQSSSPSMGDQPFSQLDLLYSHILSSVKDKATLQILGCLLLPNKFYSIWSLTPGNIHKSNDYHNKSGVQKFNSPFVLEALFGLRSGTVRRLMSDLLSVVAIGNDDQPMRILHASLGDFLLDKSRSRAHFVDPDKVCAMLARKCVKYIAKSKSSSLDFDNNVKLIILPSVTLCIYAGLLDELKTVLINLDILSAFRSFIYLSPLLYLSLQWPLRELENLLDHQVPVWDPLVWSTYTCKFQETRDKNSASPKDIFTILTGQWHDITLVVSCLSYRRVVLPNLPVAGQVCFRSPRVGDDPAIILVLVPKRPGVPDFLAKRIDKRLVESEYGINTIHKLYRYAVDPEKARQKVELHSLWERR